MATENGFVNRAVELDFILTKMDGRQRCDMLGIKRFHYLDMKRAKEWYDSLTSEMGNCSDQAKEKLDSIYHGMIGR